MKLLMTMLVFVTAAANAQNDSGSYGDLDTRTVPEIPTGSALSGSLGASVMLIDSAYVLPATGGMVRLGVGTTSLCSGVGGAPPQENHIGTPSCSAVLITEKRVMTAAHCLNVSPWADGKGNIDEKRIQFLFGYDGPLAVVDGYASIKADLVRKVKKTILCKQSKQGDVAVLELVDKAPNGFEPRRQAFSVKLGDPVHLISNPQGLPLRISSCVGSTGRCVQAAVREVDPGSNRSWFRAPLDSFRGSSGGQVVDDRGGLVGIFSGGVDHLDTGGSCWTNVIWPDECVGDFVSAVDVLDSSLFNDSKAFEDVPCEFGEAPDYGAKCPGSRDKALLTR